jgi:3-oxoacyl-[acyl-carrier protein] reductase
MLDPGLKDKSALVTGGNNPYGIGAAIARTLASHGASVFIHYFRHSGDIPYDSNNHDNQSRPGLGFFMKQQEKNADEIVNAIKNNNGKADSWECDLQDPDTISDLFDRAEETFGSVDILVNNAADYIADTFLPETLLKDQGSLWEGGPVTATVTTETHDRHFNVNSRACALAMAEFARRFAERKGTWGRIINISADLAWGAPGEVSYRASKYALESYSRSAAAELGHLGITVNVISPGPVQTGYMSSDIINTLIRDIPLQRVGKPEDIAYAVLFFASQQAEWITGQILFIHGGHRMNIGI